MTTKSTAETDDIIICHDVHKWYGDFEALRGISLTVRRGEVMVIIGPSGSGKSTFIRTINRLEEHQQGEIIVDGITLSHDIRNIAEIRREVGMVFQQFNPPPRDLHPVKPPRSKAYPSNCRWHHQYRCVGQVIEARSHYPYTDCGR